MGAVGCNGHHVRKHGAQVRSHVYAAGVARECRGHHDAQVLVVAPVALRGRRLECPLHAAETLLGTHTPRGRQDGLPGPARQGAES
jgi:hypothetical protein